MDGFLECIIFALGANAWLMAGQGNATCIASQYTSGHASSSSDEPDAIEKLIKLYSPQFLSMLFEIDHWLDVFSVRCWTPGQGQCTLSSTTHYSELR